MVFTFSCWSVFFGLGSLPVRLWDESRQAINSLEMMQSGNWLYTTFNGQPDFYNTKPPLLIWLQGISAQLFGFSAWSLRLPSAIAGLLTGLLVFVFVHRETRNQWAAALASISLMAAPGWIDEHVVRTGDYDALLCLWLSASWMSFYRFEQTGRLQSALSFVAFTFLALFTKSTAGLMLLPGLFVWGLARGSLKKLLQLPSVWWTATGFMVLLATWYIAHEYHTPGYLKTVWENEVRARFLEPSEGHHGPWYFYLQQLAFTDFPWWPVSLVGFAVCLWLLRSRSAAFAAFQASAFLSLLSLSATKIEWYAAPALPLLAAGSGLLLAPAHSQTKRLIIFAACMAAIGTMYSQTTLKRLLDPIELRAPGPEDELSLYLLGKHRELRPDTNHQIIRTDYNPTLMLYTRWPGMRIPMRTQDWKQLDSGSSYIAWHAHHLDSIRHWFDCRIIRQSGHLHLLEIKGVKSMRTQKTK
jgi:4-amino-4-deoxy-L-arabinose transferase-like glycosyltransferase